MRHLRRFNENNDNFENIIKILEDNCSQFLDELSKGSRLLYRGFDSKVEYIKVEVNKNREPRDMDASISRYIDSGFNDKFGLRPRTQGTFATKNLDVAKTYGNPFLFFPSNGYKYLWNENIDDLHDYIEGISYEDEEDDDETIRYNIDYTISKYITNNLEDCTTQELSFICDNYHLVDVKYHSKLEKYIRDRNKKESN